MTNTGIAETGQKYIMNTYGRFPIALTRGKGTYLWDANGKKYLDFVAGIAVCALGHSNDELNKVITAQAEKLWHVSNLYWIEPQVELAQNLATAAGLDKVFFCNSGAEANEAAIKLVRKYFYRNGESNKNELIVFKESFHGRTLATVTATGQAKYQEGFAPLPGGFKYAKFNNLDSVCELIDENTAGIMVEPIQGEGGIKPGALDFIKGLREICDKENLVLIFDEVQCGMGRTGNFLAFQGYGVEPNIITLAKGLGGGFPIGAMLVAEKMAGGFAPGDHASTFGGNPLATAVANEVVKTIADKNFLKEVNQKGDYLLQALKKIDDQRITEVRGRGLMLGIQFSTEIKELIAICMTKGLLLVGAGPKVIRFVPPLTVSASEIDKAVEIFKKALAEW